MRYYWLGLGLFFLFPFGLLLWLADDGVESRAGLQPLADRPPAVDFELSDPEGQRHRLSDYRGRVVLVSFWATWCPPCRREMPAMQRLWQRLGEEGFTILAVAVGETAAPVKTFAFETGVTFPLLLDPDSKTTGPWKVRGLPSSWLLDRRGRRVYAAFGGREWDQPYFVNTIRELLAETEQGDDTLSGNSLRTGKIRQKREPWMDTDGHG